MEAKKCKDEAEFDAEILGITENNNIPDTVPVAIMFLTTKGALKGKTQPTPFVFTGANSEDMSEYLSNHPDTLNM